MNILVCDDHVALREGVNSILKQNLGVNIYAEANDGKEALMQLKNQNFDVILLDISLPDISGLEMINLIKEKWPTVNILIYTMHPVQSHGVQSIRSGANGYLSKGAPMDELLLAIRTVAQGKKYIVTELATLLADEVTHQENSMKKPKLSKREKEILLKLASGLSNRTIADELIISEKSVSTYKKRITDKLKTKNNADLTKYCIKNKLIIDPL